MNQAFYQTGLKFDPDETVYVPGRGDVSLRAAVRDAMRWPSALRQALTLYRREGKTPPFFDASYIDSFAKLPAFR